MSDSVTFEQAVELRRAQIMQQCIPDADQVAKRRAFVKAMPRVRFVCGRDWYSNDFMVGCYWSKNLDAGEGDCAYQREFVVYVRFSMWVRRS